MKTEKMFCQGFVTIECLCDVVGGWQTIAGTFEAAMWRWAEREGYLITRLPEVHFVMPDYDTYWHRQKFLKVVVVARGVKVTPIETEGYAKCWSELL